MSERKDFLTADEVMERLRLGRTTVYEQARRFLATGGAEGIPCRRYGRSLRFPTAELEAMAGGPITLPDRHTGVSVLSDARRRFPSLPSDGQAASPSSASRRVAGSEQSALPFTD